MCKKDCDTADDPTCDAAGAIYSTDLYATPALCCAAKLSWINPDTCATASTGGATTSPTGTSDWYADFSVSSRCVMDCVADAGSPACGGVVGTTGGVSFYDTVEDCCTNKFGWYNQVLCQQLSLVGMGNVAVTNLWYVGNGATSCVQDCPEGAAAPTCAGNPASLGEDMYATPALCCAAKLNWIDEDLC